MEGFLIRLAIMHHENFTIDPNRDVWPFISKVFWKWVGSDSGEGDYLCMENMEDSIFDEKWIILEALPDSMLVRLLPYDDAFLSYAFQVMEIHTKSGIIIRTPE